MQPNGKWQHNSSFGLHSQTNAAHGNTFPNSESLQCDKYNFRMCRRRSYSCCCVKIKIHSSTYLEFHSISYAEVCWNAEVIESLNHTQTRSQWIMILWYFCSSDKRIATENGTRARYVDSLMSTPSMECLGRLIAITNHKMIFVGCPPPVPHSSMFYIFGFNFLAEVRIGVKFMSETLRKLFTSFNYYYYFPLKRTWRLAAHDRR